MRRLHPGRAPPGQEKWKLPAMGLPELHSEGLTWSSQLLSWALWHAPMTLALTCEGETRDSGVRRQLGILEILFSKTKTTPAGKASTSANPAPIGPSGNDPEMEHTGMGIRVFPLHTIILQPRPRQMGRI